MMNRRDMLSAAGAIVAGAFAAPALAADHAHHHAHDGANPPNASLVASALNCVKAGNACIAHCQDALIAGDTSLAACNRAADQMLAVCSTLLKLASLNSSRLPDMAKVAMLMCQDCEKECRKHADTHETCKACADACAACAEECRKAAA